MPHATATFYGKVIAETDTWADVEGNVYVITEINSISFSSCTDGKKFPPGSLDQSVLTKTDTHTSCPWKGKASYYTIKVDGTFMFRLNREKG